MVLNRAEPEVEVRQRNRMGNERCYGSREPTCWAACCLTDCKLSLKMQTDNQDRHCLLALSSTAETVVRAAPSAPLPLQFFTPFLGNIFPPVHMRVWKHPNPFSSISCPHLCHFHSLFLQFSSSLSDGLFPLRRRYKVCRLFPLFYHFNSVILYDVTTSPRTIHGILLDSQRDMLSP